MFDRIKSAAGTVYDRTSEFIKDAGEGIDEALPAIAALSLAALVGYRLGQKAEK